MLDVNSSRLIATFCGQCSCGCPQLFLDETATPDQRIVLTDDFGAQIRMSTAQFGDLLTQAKSGALDSVI